MLRAALALRNQADTAVMSRVQSWDRVHAFRAKMADRAAEKDCDDMRHLFALWDAEIDADIAAARQLRAFPWKAA